MKAIRSIIKIKDFPSFVDFKPATDLPNFARFNLIYGWNGSGKTTFSRVLQCFELGTNSQNGAGTSATFSFKLEDGSAISDSDLTAFKEIRVFNKDFIDENVFCTGGPKPIFFLGKDSKEDQERIAKEETELDSLSKDRDAKKILSDKARESREKLLSSKAREIKNTLTTARVDRYRNYEKDTMESSIEDNSEALKEPKKLSLDQEKLDSLKKSILESSGEDIMRIDLPDLNIVKLEEDVLAILNETVVSNIIDALKSDVEMSKWVEHGLGIHKSRHLDTCAFCNQKIPGERLTQLEDHFNDAYQKTLDAITSLKGRAQARRVTLSLPEATTLYPEFSSEFLTKKTLADDTVDKFNARIDKIVAALEEKERNPFSAPSFIVEQELTATVFEDINALIDKNNKKTANFEEEITADKKSIELHLLAEFMPDYTAAGQERDKAKKEHEDATAAAQTKDSDIKVLKANLLTHHIPAKEINDALNDFLGRSDITLTASNEAGGYQITRNDREAKNLSEGEKTALAIVYFISKIREDGFDLKNSIVVIDDPVSSLDANAIFQAFSFLKESIKEAGQIFILTHHFDFFRQVKNWFMHCKKDEREFFMMVCKDDAGTRKSELLPIDKLLIDYESEYHFLFSVLYRFGEKGETNLAQMYPLPNIARKFLESFLAFRVPVLKKPEPNLFNRLKEIDFDESKKTRINRFVETHSHPRYENGVQDFDMTLLAESLAVIADLLELVKTEDGKHYDFLEKSITEDGLST